MTQSLATDADNRESPPQTGGGFCLARSHAIKLVLGCLAVLAAAFAISGPQLSADWYQIHPVDFRGMSRDQLVLTSSLLEHHMVPIKLNYAVMPGTAPTVGLYGHHIIRDLSGDAFGKDRPGGFFFNYNLEHLTLRDTLNLLQRQEAAGTVPRDLILVYVSPPIFGSHLLVDENLVPSASRKHGMPLWLRSLVSKARNRIDWQGVASGLFRVVSPGCDRYGIVSGSDALSAMIDPAWLSHLPNVIGQSAAGTFRDFYLSRCTMATVLKDNGIRGYRFDGAAVGWTHASRVPEAAVARGVQWRADHITTLLGIVRDIDALARRNGTSAVFFLPSEPRLDQPENGSELYDAMVKQAHLDGLTVLDYREKFEADWLIDGAHCGDRFLERVVADLPADIKVKLDGIR